MNWKSQSVNSKKASRRHNRNVNARIGYHRLGVGKGALLLNGESDSPIKVCAVADKDPALLKLAHEDYGIGFVTEDYRELLSLSEVDVVGIFTPDHLHAEHATKALEAGKHIVCTKPMVTTMVDCERLVNLVDRTGLKFVAAMTWRHLPKIVAARRAFDEGNIGKVTLIDTGYVHDIRKVCQITPWRVTAPQDFLFGGGAHAIDCVRWFAGDIDTGACVRPEQWCYPRLSYRRYVDSQS